MPTAKFQVGQRVRVKCKCGCVDIPETSITAVGEVPHLIATLASLVMNRDLGQFVYEIDHYDGQKLMTIPECMVFPLGDSQFKVMMDELKSVKPVVKRDTVT